MTHNFRSLFKKCPYYLKSLFRKLPLHFNSFLKGNNKSHFFVILISALLAIIIELKLYRSYFRYLSFLDNICILKEDMLSLVSMIFVFLSWLWVRTILKYTRKALGTTIEIVWTISTCGFLFCEWSGLLTIAECAGFEDAGTSSPPSQSSFTPSEKEFLNGIFETEAGEPAVQQEPVGQQGAAPLPPEEISLEEFWKVVDAENQRAAVLKSLEISPKIEELICELRREERMRIPGGFQAERIVEFLAEEYGSDKLPEILQEMKENRRSSFFYNFTKSYFDNMRREHITEQILRKEWQGKEMHFCLHGISVT